MYEDSKETSTKTLDTQTSLNFKTIIQIICHILYTIDSQNLTTSQYPYLQIKKLMIVFDN